MEALYTEDQIFIPIISDYGFKATFGNESNTLSLRRALQALIKSEVPIIEVKFDKNTFEGITQDGRSERNAGWVQNPACVKIGRMLDFMINL
jgi:hypothetical protein